MEICDDMRKHNIAEKYSETITGELGYDGPLYDGFLHMTDDMLGLIITEVRLGKKKAHL